MIKITLEFPDADAAIAQNVVAAAFGGKAPAKKKVAASGKAAKATPPEEDLEEELEEEVKSDHTVKSLTALGKELVGLTDAPTLRKVLNEAGIKGKKIGDCDAKFYDAIHDGIKAAIETASEL